ncbi:MAG: zf-HC2 domain-containing protein [Candidatus Cybelea sp.]
MSRHIDELAELYALSSLDDRERAVVERHVQRCAECANRIRDAEETVAFISDLEEHHDPPETIAERFASRLALSRAEQKALSLKVITTAVVVGLMVLVGG